MDARSRGSAPVMAVLLAVGTVLTAGAVGATVTTMSSGTVTGDATTESATPTPTPEPKEVTVVIEHWEDKVGILLQSGADADAVTALHVEGAELNEPFDLSAKYPQAMGTVEPDAETVRVIATFEDGTEQVVAERDLE